MPKVGKLGLDMMYRTCTVQANLDFSSEADMVKKLRVALALQPVATALFANSPFTEGKPNGFLSFRSEIWRDTDADRSGMLPWAFEDGMGFERWVDYALDVPMYFVKRGDKYIDVAGKSFRDLLAGKLAELPGERADDFRLGQSPDARSFPRCGSSAIWKCAAPMAGLGGGLPSLPALWVGLLYDDDALDAGWDMVKDWSAAERQKLRDDVTRLGFAAEIRGRNMLTLAQETLRFAARGLARRKYLDRNGRDETRYLRPLEESIARGLTPAEELLEKFRGEWKGSVEPIFEEYAY